MPSVLPYLALLAFASAAPAPLQGQTAETHTLLYKPVADEESKYTLVVEGKFGDSVFKSTSEMTDKITEVAENGDYVIESVVKNTAMSFDGTDMPVEDAEETKTRRKYDAKGNVIEKDATDEGDEEEGDPLTEAIQLATNHEPEAAVKFGDAWTPAKRKDQKLDSLAFTLVGKEKLGEKDVLLVQGKGKARDDASVDSSIYLAPDRYQVAKVVIKITGIKPEEGPEGEFTVTVERKAD